MYSRPIVQLLVWMLIIGLLLPSFPNEVKADTFGGIVPATASIPSDTGNNTVPHTVYRQEPLQESGVSPLSAFALNGTEPGLIDNLDHFQYLFARSSNIVIDTSNPQNFGGDTRRLTRNSTATGSFTYKTDYDLASFTVSAYFWIGTEVKDLQFLASSDGVTYHPVTAQAYTSGPVVSSWQMYVYEAFALPQGTRYLKIQLEGADKSWTPQVSQTILNLNTASVAASIPSGTAVDGQTALHLSSNTVGAQIYYKQNTDTAYRLYVGAIPITTQTVIDTYAQKEGRAPSFVKTLRYHSKADWQIDRYGQVIHAYFPTKVTDDTQLQQDALDDPAYYNSLAIPSNRDAYGGLQGSAQQYGLSGKGYFSIQQVGGRPVMVTPSGNVFFSLGVNAISTNETYTKTDGREKIFEWIPGKTGPFATAFRPGSTDFSSYIANRIRKFDTPYNEEAFVKEGMKRIKGWGFNTVGAWSGNYATGEAEPHVKMLPTSNMPWAQVDGLHYFDIFADNAAQNIDEAFARYLPTYRDDPALIGYFMDNEIHFHKIGTVIPKAKASKVASKRRFVDLLKERYNDNIGAFNSSWGTSYGGFGELYETALTVVTPQAQDDLYAFIRIYAEKLYGTIADAFRRYDPNHLFLGDRWLNQAAQNTRLRDLLSEVAGEYFDVISYNYYAKDLAVSQLQAIHEKSGNKPIMITEFNFGTTEQGLNSGVIKTETQEERQLRYRNYVELAASLGYIVGTHWFNYLDQPATGRWWEGLTGERYNTGLINVADRPYKGFLQGVKQSNDDIYRVLLGERAPFQHSFNEMVRPANRTTEIAYTLQPIAINGIRDDAYDSSRQIWLQMDDRITGTGGMFMKAGFSFAWDPSNLYVFAEVTDPTPMMNSFKNANVWKGDAIELFVGSEAPEQKEGLLVSDRQLIMSAANDGGYYWQWFNTSGQHAIDMAVRKHPAGDGYSLEAAIPWVALHTTAEEGRRLRFDFGFDDSEDGIVRKRQWLWNGLDGNASNRGNWGEATLIGGPPANPAPGVPGTPVLAHDNGHDNGIMDGNYTVSMNMWWGYNGSTYKLYENDTLIDTQLLTDLSPAAQTSATTIKNRKNGTYRYTAELTNAHGTTRSQTLTVQVTQAAPAKPVISHNNWAGDGSFNISMNMWWGTNGSQYRLYENGTLVDTQTLAALTPNAQTAVTAITGNPPGDYEYRAELINDAGSAFSDIVVVRVTRP
ncbi:sugar-binding protein [Paenibacillus hodogayensis]|uniref:Sugar-binding protein n=1 Tax=Paenibacillus hodogayensis TaxID=279208 RepID=A0ABV5VVX9_9BACL